MKFPQINGAHSALGALEAAAGSRVGHMLYWFVAFSLFGMHTKLYTATDAVLAACLALCVYLLLRELRFSIGQSLAMMVLTIVAPSVQTMRFWFTVGGVQICLSLFCLGLMLALRAFVAPRASRRRLHLASWALYLASAIYAEVALPLIAVCLLVYLTRTSLVSALRRWMCDMVIVIGAYIATLAFVSTHAGFGKLPASMWSEHANLIAGQALTIFTRLLGPLSAADRTVGLAGVGALAVACIVLWRRGRIAASSRSELERWGLTFIVSLAAIVAGYAVFVPAMLYYEPLGPGLATHINSVTAIPLATGVFSVLMLTRIVCVELLDGIVPRVAYVTAVLVIAWYGVIAIDGIKAVRSDAHIWALASSGDYHVLHVLTTDCQTRCTARPFTRRRSRDRCTRDADLLYLMGTDERGKGRLRSTRPLELSYRCGRHAGELHSKGVAVSVGGVAITSPSPYRLSYFFDIPTGRYERLEGAAACTADLSQLQPGPYAITPALEWSS